MRAELTHRDVLRTLIGDEMQEALLLRIAAELEAATHFHTRKPPLYCA